MNHTLSDMLARIKNAYKVGKRTVSMPYTKIIEAVGNVLISEKYLGGLKVEGQVKKTITFDLVYVDGTPALTAAKMVSVPGVRMYKKSSSLRPILSGMGIAVISTSKGVISDKDARKQKIGGEVLMELW